MSIKHSLANKARFKNRTPEKNSEIMSIIAKKRWQKATLEERKIQGEKMNSMRWVKNKKKI